MDLETVTERATTIAQAVLRPRADEVDRSAAWPAEGIRALQSGGLGGLVVPRSYGGLGHGLFAVARVCEVLGRACASTAISFGMHLVGSAVIAAKPTPDQQRRYLDPIVRGAHLTTLALSEPATGAHFYIPESRLERSADGFRLTGSKSFVTNGGHADSYVMSVAAGDGPDPAGLSCVVVPKDAPGLRWGPAWDGWGMRGNSARTATLDEVAIERGDLLGREGDEVWYLFHAIVPSFLVAMAATYLGVASASLEEARTHVLRRKYAHTGSTLAQNVLVQNRMGSLWIEVQRARALIHDAARMSDAGDPDALGALCASKADVADAVERVTAEVMTLMGGRGYASGQRIHRHYRDARAAHVMSPTTDVLHTWVGRAWLGLPILGD